MSEEMADHSLKMLFRFRSLNERELPYAERVITHNELYFSSASSFNDPFDPGAAYDFNSTRVEREEYLRALSGRTLSHLSEHQRDEFVRNGMRKLDSDDGLRDFTTTITVNMRNEINRLGMCCFSEHCSDILMWSHYAGGHTGICLGFEATAYTPFFGRALKVEYSESYPLINPIVQSRDVKMRKLLLTKSKHWQYETEWRILDFDVPGPGAREFPPELLRVLILGMRIDKDREARVRSWVSTRQHKPEVLRAVASAKTYSLEFLPVEWFK